MLQQAIGSVMTRVRLEEYLDRFRDSLWHAGTHPHMVLQSPFHAMVILARGRHID